MAHQPLIYVSSTFVDLEEHRATLKHALERARYAVECMEKYAAFDERPLEKCLADVARADVYVLIVGHRYGFRPAEGNPGRKSITQLEYEEAARHPAKKRLVFTVDPKVPWHTQWIDDGDDARDLQAFRAAVEARHGVSRFSSPDHLASLVLQALRALESETNRVLGEATLAWNWPRPWDFSGYLAAKRRGFVGRDWLFDEVRRWYAEAGTGPQAMLITADFGVGKSAFMAELAGTDRGVPVVAWHFCHHDTANTLDPATFVRSIAAQLAAALPEYKLAVERDPESRRWLDDAQRDPPSAFERAVIAPLNAMPPLESPRVLLVDALDEALDFEAAGRTGRPTNVVRLLAGRAARFPAWLKVLVTSRRRQEVLQLMQQAFRCATLNGEDVRNLEDIRAYVTRRCSYGELARVLERAGKRASDIAALLSDAKQSGGKFLYAVRVLNDVESGELPLHRLESLPPGMDAFYLDAFERRFPQGADYERVRPLMAALSVIRGPISRPELAAILQTQESAVRDVLARIEDFLSVRGRRYAFDHLSLAQWLTEENESGFVRAGRFAVDASAAGGLMSSWARREVAEGRAHASEYLARHLPVHLNAQEREAAFTTLLLDLRWLDARLRVVGINALLADWAHAEATPQLRTLERALRLGAHVLGHEGEGWSGPDLLATQILGRLSQRRAPGLRALREQAIGHLRRAAWLRPLTASLQASEALLRTLEGHEDWVTSLAVLPDGRLASGSEDESVRIWNLASGACEAALEGHTGWVTSVAVVGNRHLASGAWDGTIRIWNVTSGACEATLEGRAGRVTALIVLPDGRLASGAWDGTILLWNVASGAREATLSGHAGPVSSLAVLPDGRLASGSADRTIRFWNPASGACEAVLEAHTDRVAALAVLPDGRLASGAWDRTVRLWNLKDGACETTLDGRAGRVRALVVLPDHRLACGTGRGVIKIWSPTTGACEATLEGHAGGVRALVVLPDRRLASGSGDRTIKLWNPSGDERDTKLDGHGGGVRALAELPRGRLASGASYDTIKVWNVASAECETTLEGQASLVTALAGLPDGRVAEGTWDGTITLWSAANATREATFVAHAGAVMALVALPDGRLTSASRDDTIKVWNVASGLCETTFKGHTRDVLALAVLSDGRLASGSADRTIRLWNPASGTCERTLVAPTSSVTALVSLPDGRLVSGSGDGAIRLWNPAGGACEETLLAHAGGVMALAALPDGRFASGSSDKTIRIWELRDDRATGSVQFVADAGIFALAFVRSASCLVAGDSHGRVHFLGLAR